MYDRDTSKNSGGKENRSHHVEKREGVNKPRSPSLRHSSFVFPAALGASTDVTLALRAKDLHVFVCVCAHICVRAKSLSTGAQGSKRTI